MSYIKTPLNEEIVINEIVTIHYFEFASDYSFKGESHDFWEFVYTDKGEIEVMSDTAVHKLKHGEMIFHKPNEFHSLWSNGIVAPNVIVISFYCDSIAMKFFENKIIQISDNTKKLLAQIIREAKEAFSSPLNVSFLEKLEKKAVSPFGCEQLIKIYLQELLINLRRNELNIISEAKLSSSVKEGSEDDLIKEVMAFLNQNISLNLSFEDICKFSGLGKTSLKIKFKSKTGTGVMEYFKLLKIEESKKLIREGQYNFSEIADKLGYSSIHYFSRDFKKSIGMTPSEYSISVKVKI